MVSPPLPSVSSCSHHALTCITGFAVVGQYQEASIQNAQATAYDQMLKWLKEH